jgi:hypothetical protein
MKRSTGVQELQKFRMKKAEGRIPVFLNILADAKQEGAAVRRTAHKPGTQL